MLRRSFIVSGAEIAGAAATTFPADPWVSCGAEWTNASDRLDQGPFDINRDGWRTLVTTTPSQMHVRNFGLGLVGYTWEENGPSSAARKGQETLEAAVEKLAKLPFVDVLYIRCDWRNVQSRPGRLDLNPVWDLTIDAARRHGLRFAFRIQLSNPKFEPDEIALPEFLRNKVPLQKSDTSEGMGAK